MQVDTVEEWAADARAVALDLRRRAAIFVAGIAQIAAFAGVHRGHKHHRAGERDFPGAARNGNLAVFEGLALGIEERIHGVEVVDLEPEVGREGDGPEAVEAGGIDPALEVGDVVIPEKWAYHSEAAYLNEDGKGGYVRPDYFRASGLENFGMMFPDGVRAVREGEGKPANMMAFPVDGGLLEVARRVVAKLPPMKKAGRTVSVSVGGTGVSGPVFLDNAKYREWVFRVWRARCLDMESTAYAHVCWANKKPLLVIRGLSDLAGGQHGKNPIDANELSVSAIATKVLRAVLDEMTK